MSSLLLDEEVPPVNPLSINIIEELGRCFLSQLAPDSLSKPQPLNVLELVDSKLPQFGIHVCPASREEIGDRHGATDPQGSSEINILVDEKIWNALEAEAPRSHYAKTTVCHEVGHAVLHVPILRRKLLIRGGDVLARVQRRNLRAYEDPEWQAWMFAGAILMPSDTLHMLQEQHNKLEPGLVSKIYEVSEKMADSHLRKLKWPYGTQK